MRNVAFDNFPKYVKPERDSRGEQPLEQLGKGRYHLHQQQIGPNGCAQFTHWGDIRIAEKEIAELGRHREIVSSSGATARLDEAFLVFNGFPCNNTAGLNQAKGVNGQQRSMQPGAAGPKTGLYYQSERIIEKILSWREESQAQQQDASANDAHQATEDDYCEVSDRPFACA